MDEDNYKVLRAVQAERIRVRSDYVSFSSVVNDSIRNTRMKA
jgi:hypothetical protein